MLFKKKKQKIDPKIRFQNRQFNQKLQEARGFKRTARAIPEGSSARFLSSIGLGSRWRQVLAIVILGGIIYLIYIPNFLTWQNIRIEGMSQADTATTESAIRDNINHVKFYNPQRNLLFLSKRRLTEVVNSIAAVSKINSIKRDFKNKAIKISITSKYERFLVRSNDSVYDVYNDGSTKGIAGINHDYWESVQNPNMVKVQVDGKITNPDNKQFLIPETVQYINELQDQAKGIIGSSLSYVKITLPEFRQPDSPIQETNTDTNTNSNTNSHSVASNVNSNANSNTVVSPDLLEPIAPLTKDAQIQLPLKADELELIMQKGNDPKRTFRVIVDTKESANNLIQRLNLLLSQTAPDRYNGLVYIDMRVQTRAFVCLANAPCNK